MHGQQNVKTIKSVTSTNILILKHKTFTNIILKLRKILSYVVKSLPKTFLAPKILKIAINNKPRKNAQKMRY